MPNIARTTPRPAARPIAQQARGRTKVLLVRQPVKSVRQSDHPDRLPVKLAIGVIIVIGVLVTVWLMGYLGYRMGFARLIRVPELVGEGGGGIVTGAMMLLSMPISILQAGIDQPLWMMLGFALISIPAASLGAIQPSAPGGPRPKPVVVVTSFIGAITGALTSLVLLWWSLSPLRAGWIGVLPVEPAQVARWMSDLQIAAGLDALGLITAALWAVVIMRLTIPVWLRALTGTACFFTLSVMIVTTAASNVAVSQFTAPRPVFISSDDATNQPRVLIGFTPRHAATLEVSNGAALVQLADHPTIVSVHDTRSIAAFLQDAAPRDDRYVPIAPEPSWPDDTGEVTEPDDATAASDSGAESAENR
jgi:hypothetical protein